MENYFGIYVIFGRWNQHQQRPTASTTHQGVLGTPWSAQVSCALPVSQLGPFFGRKKDNLWDNHVNISAQSELRIFRDLRNGEGPENRNTKQR